MPATDVISTSSAASTASAGEGSTASRTPMQPLRVCMVSDDFRPSFTGVGVVVQAISRELASRGHHVSVITTRRPGEPAFETWEGVRVHRTFSVKAFDFWISLASKRSLRKILRSERPDIVHYHYAGVLLRRTHAVARRTDAKCVYTYHMTVEHITQDSRLLKACSGRLQRMINGFCNQCDLVTAPTINLAREIPTLGITAPTHYLANPIAFEDAATHEPIEQSGKFVILFAGRLHPEKNLPLLIRAFGQLAGDCDARESAVWIAGDGYMKGKLEALAKELGIADRVRFLGFVDHSRLGRYYAAASVFVLPSLVETQGMVAIEAMRFAKPVIVTHRIVSARDLVEPGVNGFIVDADSPEELAGRLRELRDDDGLRDRMGQASRTHSDQYATEAVVADFERRYGELLGPR